MAKVQPMKAPNEKLDLNILKLPMWGSYKLDGIRSIFPEDTEDLRSNSMKPIPNIATQNYFQQFEEMLGMDNELIVGDPTAPDCFRKTSSGVMSIDGDPKAHVYVFDHAFMPGKPYSERYAQLREMVRKVKSQHPRARIRLIRHRKLGSIEEIQEFMQESLNKGYEGIILRNPDSLYKYGRATEKQNIMYKYKPWEDSEAVVTGYYELMHNDNEQYEDELGRAKRSSHQGNLVPAGTLGGVNVRDIKSGVEFNIGVFKGFTAEAKQKLWNERETLIGKIVKYQFMDYGIKEKPRLPKVLGFRHPDDINKD